MTFPHFVTSVFVILLLCISGFTSPSVAADSAPNYLPGRLIVKLEDDQTFFKQYEKFEKTGIGQFEKSGISGKQPERPADLIESRLQPHGLQRMSPIFRSGTASDAAARVQTRTDSPSARLEELAKGFERTYHIRYNSGGDPLALSEEIRQWPGVVYAEPHYVHKTTYTPNDPLIGEPGHDYFEYQNFFNAWAVTQGSSDVVIAIVDTGVFFDHPDLINKLWQNPEPGRANARFEEWEIVNDTIGWNFWESGDVFSGEEPVQNAYPVGNYSTHGTHVAGIAAADTDNSTGIAGTGFQSKFMPVKVGGTQSHPRSIAYGYEGILYAAINKADIINCSFGGPDKSEFGKYVVEFATEHGSLVVAAAGNESEDRPFFPAAYENVLAVGSVRAQYNDAISSFSNYGFFVDVFAMGESVLSTYFDYDENAVSWSPRYNRVTGTSMSAPVVSGLAALIKASHPEWTPQRIALQIRTNARTIDAQNPQSRYDHRLGTGLIDAHAALTNLNPGLIITDFSFEAADGGKINVGESGTLTLSGINYGEPTSGVMLNIQPLSSGITIEPESKITSSVPSDATFTSFFDVTISRDLSLDNIPAFRLNMSDGSQEYNDFYMILYERLLFETLDINNLAVSISSDGTIGFMDAITSSGGVGFIPKNHDNILFEGGLMISAKKQGGFSGDRVPVIINQVRDSTDITRHFLPVENLRFSMPGELSDVDGSAIFHSSRHPVANELSIEMQTFAFAGTGIDQAFFIKYSITNKGPETLEDMHVGLFNDWDIADYENNFTAYIEEDSLIYAYGPIGTPYVAVAHLGSVSSAFAIDNTSPMSLPEAESREDSLRFGIHYQSNSNLNHFDGFTDDEKRLALTAGTERTDISGTDISIVTGTGPFTLMPLASIDVGFVYAWGKDVDELRSQVDSARTLQLFETSVPGQYARFDDIADRVTLYQNFPNPFNNTTTIEFHLPVPGHAELAVYNLLGQRITTLVNQHVDQQANYVSFDASRLASGVYIAVLKSDDFTRTIKMSLIK